MARAALAAGADGLLIEVHPDPAQALSDGPQALDCEGFARLMLDLRQWLQPAGRRLARPLTDATAAGADRAEARSL